MHQCTTPALDDHLYLQFQGLKRIEALQEYTGLRSLWLEGNGIHVIEHLGALEELRVLCLRQNSITRIGNLEQLRHLDTLNLSTNLMTAVAGLGALPKLTTLLLSHNRLKSVQSIAGLSERPSLTTVDLAHNEIEGVDAERLIELFGRMPNLVLHGNPITEAMPSYRKAVISKCKKLDCLDGRPVMPLQKPSWEGGAPPNSQRAVNSWRSSGTTPR